MAICESMRKIAPFQRVWGRLALVAVVSLTVGWLGVSSAAAEKEKTEAAPNVWESITVPDNQSGLVVTPRFLSLGRLYCAWGWSNKPIGIEENEFTFSQLKGEEWTKPTAPFFGKNVGNVRRVALATAKNIVGALYQRTMEQDDTALEVCYTFSNDSGWSYSLPKAADSYVNETAGGTAVDIAGVGGRKPSFAFGWLSESRTAKAALFDPNYVGDRPRAIVLGHYGSGCERIELAGEDDLGFMTVWNEGSRLKSARIKPLVGEAEPSMEVFVGKVGLNFSLTDLKGKNATLVYDMSRSVKGQCRRQVRTWKKGAWQTVAAAAPTGGDFPVSLNLEATQDENRTLHVASLARDGETISYSRLENGRFTNPEVAVHLKPVIGVTGFDISVKDNQVYIVAAQGPFLQVVRRSLKK